MEKPMLRRSDIPAMRIRFPSRIMGEILEARPLGLGACRNGKLAVRPVAPRSRVQSRVRQSRQLHREQLLRRVDAGAAIEDGAVAHAHLAELLAQLLRGLEPAV